MCLQATQQALITSCISYRLLHDDMKESGLLPVTGRLLKSFNFAYQPRSHAVDLVQALHVILRMLDRLNASGTSCHAAA